MEDKKITPQELKTVWMKDIDQLADRVAAAINNAQPGSIIDDSEEPVRDANAEFRQRAYQQAINLLQNKQLQEDFFPSPQRTKPDMEK